MLRRPGQFRPLPLAALSGATLTGGCVSAGPHSALDPAGPGAAHIHDLWLIFFWVCTAVFLLVMGALAFAVLRPSPAPDRADLSPRTLRSAGVAIGTCTAITILILGWFTLATFATERRVAGLATADALTISVTGRQWWWDITYEDANPSRTVRTANEIHVPVGQPVLLRLFSADVIHSFWVPNLQGKRDLVPGRENQLWLQADRPGVFEGQCAEFCGHQHAHMRLLIVAQPPEEFAAWRERQLAPAVEPAGELARQGREVFLRADCIMCHTVRGTLALSRVGPDLTHLASRRTLGAGSRPNQRGHLAGWILDPQSVKPGARMPGRTLPAADFHALLAYLESLE